MKGLTIPGRLAKNTKVPSGTPCLVDTAAVNNLPQRITVNHYLAHPKGNVVPVIKCLNTWLCQGILCPSNSPYASQVVTVCKNFGEICLCVVCRKLNSITIRDAFPLPHIDEALQAMHSSNVFTSFDLVQGYL